MRKKERKKERLNSVKERKKEGKKERLNSVIE